MRRDALAQQRQQFALDIDSFVRLEIRQRRIDHVM